MQQFTDFFVPVVAETSRLGFASGPETGMQEVCQKVFETLARNLLLAFAFPWLHRGVPKAQPFVTEPSQTCLKFAENAVRIGVMDAVTATYQME